MPEDFPPAVQPSPPPAEAPRKRDRWVILDRPRTASAVAIFGILVAMIVGFFNYRSAYPLVQAPILLKMSPTSEFRAPAYSFNQIFEVAFWLEGNGDHVSYKQSVRVGGMFVGKPIEWLDERVESNVLHGETGRAFGVNLAGNKKRYDFYVICFHDFSNNIASSFGHGYFDARGITAPYYLPGFNLRPHNPALIFKTLDDADWAAIASDTPCPER